MYKIQIRKNKNRKWKTIRFMKTMDGIKKGFIRSKPRAKFIKQNFEDIGFLVKIKKVR